MLERTAAPVSITRRLIALAASVAVAVGMVAVAPAAVADDEIRTISGTFSVPEVDLPEFWQETIVIYVYDENDNWQGSAQVDFDAMTFLKTNLAPGKYRVEFAAGTYCGGEGPCELSGLIGGWYGGGDHGVLIDVTDDDVSNLHYDFELGLSISGTISLGPGADPAWKDALFATVTIPGPDGCPCGDAITTKADPVTGEYTLRGLRPGSYTVYFEGKPNPDITPTVNLMREWYNNSYTWDGASYVDVTESSATGIDATLEVGRTISGVVTLPGGVPEDAYQGIEVFAEGTDISQWVYADVDAETGEYIVTGLSPTQYTLRFIASDWWEGPNRVYTPLASVYYGGSYVEASSATVDVSTTNASDRDQTMPLGRTISGTVSLGGGVDPEFLGHVVVSASDNALAQYRSAEVDADTGAYTIRGLAPSANYLVEFVGNDFQRYNDDLAQWEWIYEDFAYEFYNNKRNPYVADLVSVSAGNATGINATMDWQDGPREFWVAPTPSIEGVATFGETLSVNTGAWEPWADLSYVWKRNGADIAGATGPSYQVSAADVGQSITVAVTGERPDFTAVTKTSAAVTPAAAAFTTASTPTIAGTATVGQTLTANPGLWSPTPTLTFQWTRNGSDIPAATTPNYTLTNADAGAEIAVRVTGSLAGYVTTPKTSSAVSVGGGTFTSAPTPLIDGLAQVGFTLTADPQTWSPSPALTYQWTRNGVDIDGATSPTYDPVPGDVGVAIAVKVTGTLTGFTTTTRTSSSVTVQQGVFGVAPTPTISGTATVGQTLAANPGSWEPLPAFAYQWTRNGQDIAGATSSTYTLVGADAGTAIRVKVTATRDGYQTQSKVSNPTSTVSPGSFTQAPTPTISGEAAVGQTLAASVDAWSPVATFAYQWLRDGADIIGATNATYTLVSADAGKKISVKVTGSAAGYQKTTTVSAETATVLPAVFTTAPKPTISGSFYQGGTVKANEGTWVPAASGYAYQWYRDGKAISGATAKTYKLTASDSGKKLTVKVTASAPGVASKSATSASKTLSKFFTKIGSPYISGTVKVGKTVTAAKGTWSPTPSSYSYQWYRDGVAISGATKSTYKLVAADAGKKLTVKVTAKRSGYASQPKTSAAKTVAKGTFSTAPTPKISGTVKVGKTVSVTVGTWSPSASFTYQWYRSGTAISGATSKSYKLVAADAGKKLTVKVTAKKSGYTSKSKTSAAATVAKGTFSTAPTPKISGTVQVGKTVSVTVGTWSPTPSSYSYQWYRDGKAISGATKSTYKLVASDAAKKLTVKVTAKKSGYTSKSKTSAAKTVAKATFTTAPAPTISGTLKVGSTLTATPGTWSPTPSSFTYQWYRGDTAISGATKATYKLVSADKGKTIKVKVTAKKSGYTNKAKTSVKTTAIK